MSDLTTLEMVNLKERSTFFVKANHIVTLRTTMDYNGTIYQQHDGKYILQHSLNGRYGSSELGTYISEKTAKDLIDRDAKGEIMDERVSYYYS